MSKVNTCIQYGDVFLLIGSSVDVGKIFIAIDMYCVI